MKIGKKFNPTSLIFELTLETLSIIFFIFLLISFHSQQSPASISSFVFLILLGLTQTVLVFQLFHSSRKDKLTNIPNGDTVIFFAVSKFIQKQFPLYNAVFLNIKNFKYINRMVGNDYGDVVLAKYAGILEKYLVKGEGIGRMGGDNFVILIYKHRLNDFLTFLDDIIIPVEIKGSLQEIPVHARCGIHSLDLDSTIGDVFNKSSIALNYAKANIGEDYVWYKQEMSEILYKEKEIVFLFQEAIRNRKFKVFYQPIVDISVNKMTGAEALVRWELNGKLEKPDNFIGILERTGLVTDLDYYVLEKVCRDIKEWEKKGLAPVKISTNFSKHHLKDPDFGSKVFDIITRNGVSKDNIIIELTESTSIGDEKILTNFLQNMSDTGIKVEIDDFGIGYSSFELLKNSNVSGVKIDKSFINEIEINHGSNVNASLVRNIIHACHDLKKNIICEGIENSAQQELLKEMRCNLIQGFLFDQPLARDVFEKRLSDPYYSVRE